jgi:hypothetical protein
MREQESIDEREWVDDADNGFEEWFHSLYGGYSLRCERFNRILEIEDHMQRKNELMSWLKASFFAGYECSLYDKLEKEQND